VIDGRERLGAGLGVLLAAATTRGLAALLHGVAAALY